MLCGGPACGQFQIHFGHCESRRYRLRV